MRRRVVLPGRQQGLALIMVLLIFAIVSVLAVSMMDRQSNDIQRSATMLALQQARAYVLGAESAVKTGLYLDWDNNPDVDHALEEWATDRSFPLSPGMAFIRIRDAQGRFNLNSLSATASNRAVQKERFENLLNILGLDVTFADLLYKWMDEESQEDDRYLSLELPYRAAYQGCVHTSELMLLEGLDEAAYRRLEPYVVCLPVAAQLNVNSASAVVLAALDTGMTLDIAQAIISARGDEGFASVDDFWALSDIESFVKDTGDEDDEDGNDDGENTGGSWDKTDFSVKSEYFESFIRVDLGDRVATAEVLIERDNDDGRMTTLYRDYGRREARPEAELSDSTTTQ